MEITAAPSHARGASPRDAWDGCPKALARQILAALHGSEVVHVGPAPCPVCRDWRDTEDFFALLELIKKPAGTRLRDETYPEEDGKTVRYSGGKPVHRHGWFLTRGPWSLGSPVHRRGTTTGTTKGDMRRETAETDGDDAENQGLLL